MSDPLTLCLTGEAMTENPADHPWGCDSGKPTVLMTGWEVNGAAGDARRFAESKRVPKPHRRYGKSKRNVGV